MMKKPTLLAAAAVLSAGMMLAGTAQAASYFIESTSALGNVRHFGGALIPEINDYQPVNPSGLDPTNPNNWPLMHATQGTWDPNNPTVPPVRGGVGTAVDGIISIVGGNVTAATINQLNALTYGTFQSYDFVNGYGTVTDLVTNGLIWTYNPITNQLNHQAGTNLAVCVPASGGNFGGSTGTAVSGQCNSSLRPAINSANATSLWNWDGIVADQNGFIIRDVQNAPYHTGTGLSLNVGPARPGVIWDLSGFVDGVGGTVIAHVFANIFNSNTNNATVVAGTYTLNLVPVPVPAAVWLFGGALGLLGFARRRAAA